MHYHYFTLEQRNALREVILSRLEDRERDPALDRLRAPDYGVCDTCGTDIPFSVLLGNPLLRRCAGCR